MRARTKRHVPAAIVLVVIAALTTFAQTRRGQAALTKIGIVAPSRGFTELAFVDPGRLLNTLYPRPRVIRIPFTITNHTTRVIAYRWEVVVAGTGRRVARAGSVQLAAGRAISVDPRFKLGCTVRARVDVELASGESIGFWATCLRHSPAPPNVPDKTA